MKFSQILLQILFPTQCITCKTSMDSGFICDACLATIRVNETFFCATCHARLPNSKKTCHRESPYILGAVGSYKDDFLKKIILDLKFRGIRKAAVPLGNLASTYLTHCRLSLERFIIIPLPLTKRRERERGFNQSAEIARELAKNTALPLAEHVLLRTKHTKPQTETENVAERQINIKDCFSVTDSNDVAGKNILLIDDVTTSGATFREASRVLKRAGAKIIIALAIAKA